MSKYGNKRVKADGYTFDSQAEYARYTDLKLAQKLGEISELVVHPRYLLLTREKLGSGEILPAVRYVGDFQYLDRGRVICEDVKGMQTAVFKIKANLFRRKFRDVELRIVPA